MNRLHFTQVHPHTPCTKSEAEKAVKEREHTTGDHRHQDSREKVMLLFPTTCRFLYQYFSLLTYFCLIININLFVQHDKKGTCDST